MGQQEKFKFKIKITIVIILKRFQALYETLKLESGTPIPIKCREIFDEKLVSYQ